MSVEKFTPVMLRDLYFTLSREDKDAFLKMIASTAREPVMMAGALSALEREKYSKLIYAVAIDQALPYLLAHAIESAIALVRERPQISDEEMRQVLKSEREKWTRIAAEVVIATEREKMKQSRDRKSDPETVRRNVEICDLRIADKKKWSQEKLAKKYDVTKQYISNVLKDEVKWRKLLSELPSVE